MACAFGSVQGLLGDGFGLLGQLNTAICVTFVPGLKITVTGVIVGIKFAVTVVTPLRGAVQVGVVPALAQAPPHPAKVEGAVAMAVRLIELPAKVAEQLPVVTPCFSMHSISSSSETLPLPLPSMTIFRVEDVCPVTVSVVLVSVALAKVASPA